MRIIDADEVIRFYNEQFPDLDSGVHWSRNDIIMNLDNIPTIEAVPTEWLEKNYGWLTMTGEIIKDWEKENESDCGN